MGLHPAHQWFFKIRADIQYLCCDSSIYMYKPLMLVSREYFDDAPGVKSRSAVNLPSVYYKFSSHHDKFGGFKQ